LVVLARPENKESNVIDIRGKSALVTGANRGLGRAFAEALLEAGAGRVYAGARDPSTVKDHGVTPIRLDVTKPEDVAAAAARCGDVQIIINNAGAMLATPVLAEDSEYALRRAMEVNVFGMLAMARAFAPVLGSHGGGIIVNMLSVVSWYVYPFNGTYCVTKHAALALTDGLQIQLKGQGIRVMGVYAGFIDTDMGAALSSGPKTPPGQVARKTVEGILNGVDHVLADERAESIWTASRENPARLQAEMQTRWDETHATTSARS
jgi:NAD(P)-dependent dehydrogenase (short-subunit alcohol dehydrogenase family)